MARQSASRAAQNLRNLAQRHGTPLFLIRRSVVREQLNRFRKALRRVEPFYAIKANPHPGILKTLVAAGAGFDVASKAEMEAALSAGAAPERIIFANTIKPAEAIATAAREGVLLTTFDSEYELYKIAEHSPKSRVLVRIKVPNIGSVVELSLKFGVDPSDAVPLLIKARRLGLTPAGVSFHVGSQCTHMENYVESLEMAAIIVRDAKLKQFPLEIVDIGGGFPIPHLDGDEDQFDKTARVIAREIERLFDRNLRIIAEPGRFISGPSATLVMRVIGKAIRENKHWYYLDDGVYGDLSGIMFDHAKYQFNVLRSGRRQLSTLAGPTCDSLDIIARGEDLPELEIGDIVYVNNVGAYSSASATTFNGIAPAKIVVVQ
ncbi:MAG: type III PLP-dependent enzyme [Candidatus Aureabacteria bacterium]|nr:type III PLP-dependent enzyme [Candidatus Auribacterota bacterium]